MNYYDKIKFLVMDVDGTLTDGKIYMSDQKEVMKAFDIKDGCGIKEILPRYGIIPVIITARKSKIVECRCNELNIYNIHQACNDKLEELKKIVSTYSHKDKCNYSFENVAYIGDDITDLECMKAVVQAGGLTVCPANAADVVSNVASYVCLNKCGESAVREFIDWLVSMKTGTAVGLKKVKDISKIAYDFIIGFSPGKSTDGRYNLDCGVFADVMSYYTKPIEMTCYESHKQYIDIQYIIYGIELLTIENVKKLKKDIISEYDNEKDVTSYKYSFGDLIVLNPGNSIVIMPFDAYRSTIALKQPMKIRKIKIKVPINE